MVQGTAGLAVAVAYEVKAATVPGSVPQGVPLDVAAGALPLGLLAPIGLL